MREIVLDEAARQGWTLPEREAQQVFALDIELNAQGFGARLDASRA